MARFLSDDGGYKGPSIRSESGEAGNIGIGTFRGFFDRFNNSFQKHKSGYTLAGIIFALGLGGGAGSGFYGLSSHFAKKKAQAQVSTLDGQLAQKTSDYYLLDGRLAQKTSDYKTLSAKKDAADYAKRIAEEEAREAVRRSTELEGRIKDFEARFSGVPLKHDDYDNGRLERVSCNILYQKAPDGYFLLSLEAEDTGKRITFADDQNNPARCAGVEAMATILEQFGLVGRRNLMEAYINRVRIEGNWKKNQYTLKKKADGTEIKSLLDPRKGSAVVNAINAKLEEYKK